MRRLRRATHSGVLSELGTYCVNVGIVTALATPLSERTHRVMLL